MSKMRLKEIGEFGLIKRLTRQMKFDSSVVKGPGDDCAVLEFDRKNYLLATCDMITEAMDFRRNDPPYLIGRKALAVSISDIASCGGIPRYALVSLGLPAHASVELAEKICKGMTDLAKNYKINIVGGDISAAGKITVDVSMLGFVEKKFLALRSRARKSDIIFVTGSLGGSIRGKHLNFEPRLNEARSLVKNFKINAMIDISDGLLQDLGHILEQSSVGAVIYENLVPLSKDAKNLSEALYMGEDFELLFTVPKKEAARMTHKILKKLKIRAIGEIVDRKSGLRLVDKNNKIKIPKLKGFSHF